MDRQLCIDCKTDSEFFFDGFCMSCWPGYDSCARPQCGHYRCEHNFPGKNTYTLAYSKDNPETVGKTFEEPVGCMVHDGPDHCSEFLEKL